ncbi:MAG: Calx-beta domain-containing protein [Pseudomonadota bacterium]
MATISLTASGTAYTQNFDGLGTNTGGSIVQDDPAANSLATLLPGWAAVEAGTAPNTTYSSGTGSSTTGDTYNFGTSAADRALGSLASNAQISTFGAAFTNDTGGTISSLLISYVGELYRVGAVSREDKLDFQISYNATSLTTGTWVDVDALDYKVNSAAGTALGVKDGNLAANQTALSTTLSGLAIATGATFWIRWIDVNVSGNDDALAIDSFSITPTAAVGGAGSFAIGNLAALAEGSTGATTDFGFTVTRSGGTAGAVTIPFTIDSAGLANGASAGDFQSLTGTVSFADGQTEALAVVKVNADATPELDEAFRVTLGTPSAGSVTTATATGTIVNDDGAPIQVAIGDVSVTEGNSGPASMTFTVTRSGGSGAFDVNYATADGTATVAGNDYTAQSGTLSFGVGENSKTITVLVTGDTTQEPSETLVVNLSSATNDAVIVDAQGVGTITDDDVPLTLIHDIQGTSYFSPLVAAAGIAGYGTGASTTVNATPTTVTVRAVVTAIDGVGARQGFYITEEAADWDANNFTSEGIFVMTRTDSSIGTLVSSIAGLAVGTVVTVTANIMEYRPFNTNGPLTVLVNPTVQLGQTNQPLPILTLDASHKIPNSLLTGVAPVYNDSVDDAGDSFDATNYAMSFFETIEGMLVTVPDVRVADGFTVAQGGGTNFKVYSGVSANPEQINSRGGYTIAGDPPLSPPDTASTTDNTVAGGKGVTDGDINPDILELDFSDFALTLPGYLSGGALSMGDKLGDVTGVVEWNFTDMKLFPTAISQGSFVDTTLTKEVTTIVTDPRALTFATFNVENLGGNATQARFDAVAQAIKVNLGSPAILSIEEIQDNNGAAAGDGTSSTGSDATTTWTKLVAALNLATGKIYQWVDQAPVYNAEGGEQSGNIRVGFLYDTGRVQLGNLAADAPIEERRKFVDRLGDNVRDAGDLIAYSDNMVSGINTADYTTTRLSLLGQFTFNGNTVFALANHLPSKGGSGTFWDAGLIDPQNGTPTNSDWDQRSKIGEDIYTLLNYIQGQNPNARVLSGGDYNDFYFYRPLETATGYVFADGTARNDGAKLINLALALPEAERYTYTFDGRSQAIDHILADAATAAVARTDVVHINSGFLATGPNARISDHDPVLTSINLRSFGETLNGTTAGETIEGFGGDDIIDGKGGTDTLVGGIGNDIYIVDSLDDVVTELAGEGFDEVRTTVAGYVLPANVEKLTFIGTTGTGNQNVNGNAGDNTLGGGTGGDRFDLSQGGADTVDAGAGDDGIYFGAAFGAGDVVNGGAGTNDQLALQGNYAGGVTLSAANVTGVEVVVLQSGAGAAYAITTANDLVASGAVMSIYGATLAAGETFTFNGGAETDGAFRIYGGAGADVLTGGSGDDGFLFGPGKFDPTVDRVDGGAGSNDQLALDGDYTVTLDGTSIRNVEVIVLLEGTAANKNDFVLTIADSFVPVGETRTINGALTSAAMSVNGAGELNGNLILTGGRAADTLIGGSGADILFGGMGGDTLTGGAGADIFRYSAVAQSSSTYYDTITDFVYGSDTVDLPGTYDVYARVTTGSLSTASFDADLQAAMTGQLTVGGAVVFTASAGTLSGATFVVVDANGVAGYQADQDYVIRIDGAVPGVIPDFIV